MSWKKIIFLIVFGALFINLVFSSADENKINLNVYGNLTEKEEIGVYIKFEKQEHFFNFLSEDIEQTKEEIKKIGKDIKYESENEIYIDIAKEDLRRLEEKDNIKNIEVEGIRNLFLQDTIKLTNASNSWNLRFSEVNLTGDGQGVCVIDSGIDFNHINFGSCNNETFLAGNCSKVPAGFDFFNNNTNPFDENGHGTHVSGIIAAESGINQTGLNGIAPKARIIALKVCDASGVCYDSAISSAINYCVQKKEEYNIKVISMSLGAGLYSDECNNDPLADEIQNAISNGISVVIASGNGLNNVGAGAANKISSPACVGNVTAVSAIDKNNNIATSYADRNHLIDLVSYGSGINSTFLNSSQYAVVSGTSMAAPHVSGALLILNQFLELNNKSKTPQELKNILNNTGKKVIDLGNNGINPEKNYSRIDIYSALISLDEIKPNVTLLKPEDELFSSNLSQKFNCNATDFSLDKIIFYLWNSNNTVVNESLKEISGESNNFEINISNLKLGEKYKWNCLYSDENGNSAFAEKNYTLNSQGVIVSLNSPLDNSYYNKGNISFSCNGESKDTYSLSNLELNVWNLTSLIYSENKTINGNLNSSDFSYFVDMEGNYSWNCLGANNNSESRFSIKNYSFIYDITKPEVSLDKPDDGNSVTGSQDIEYKFSILDNYEINSCGLILNKQRVFDNQTKILTEQSNTFVYTTNVGNYNWSISCSDLAGNVGNSSSRNLNVNSSADNSENSGGSGSSGSSGSGSGGGGGSGSSGSSSNGNSIPSTAITSSVIADEIKEINESGNETESNRIGITGAAITELAGDFAFPALVLIALAVVGAVIRAYVKKREVSSE